MARKVILICASMSLLAHAMAVTLWSSSDHPVRVSQHSTVPSWHVRSVAASEPARGRSDALIAQAPIGVVSDGDSQQPSLAPHPQDREPAEPTSPAHEAPIPDVVNTPASPAQPASPVLAASEQGWSDYVPRPQLSVPPLAQAPVLIAPPAGDFEPQRVVGVLSLYINEYGAVDHVASTGDELPPAFEQAAIAAFQHITFTPGQLDGQAVKSRIKVEVVFDNTPLEPLPPGSPHP